MALTTRQRKILRLKCAGWNATQIAGALHIAVSQVRRDIHAMNNHPIPGVTTGEEPYKAYRMVYTLGLLDAGVAPGDVPKYLDRLTENIDPANGLTLTTE